MASHSRKAEVSSVLQHPKLVLSAVGVFCDCGCKLFHG